jgi:hypothetical protein
MGILTELSTTAMGHQGIGIRWTTVSYFIGDGNPSSIFLSYLLTYGFDSSFANSFCSGGWIFHGVLDNLKIAIRKYAQLE